MDLERWKTMYIYCFKGICIVKVLKEDEADVMGVIISGYNVSFKIWRGGFSQQKTGKGPGW